MEVTLAGIFTAVRELQLSNAEAPMEVTPSGIVTEVNFSVDIPFGIKAATSVFGATP